MECNKTVNLFLTTTIAIVDFQLNIEYGTPLGKVLSQSLVAKLQIILALNLTRSCDFFKRGVLVRDRLIDLKTVFQNAYEK